MGIDQLVNAYKGNPQPLQAKVQQAQKGQPPGAIPPDLEEAIALQKITELRNSAQAQQAMQAGGAQPSIVEKLRQMLSADQRQQAQPPQMPQMAQGPQAMPQGQPPQQPPQPPQGVDALPTNVGQQYAEGGIIGNVRHFDQGGKTSMAGDFFRSLIDSISGGLQQTSDYAKAKSEQEKAEPGLFEALTPQEREERLRRAKQASEEQKRVISGTSRFDTERQRNIAEANKQQGSPTDPDFRRARYTDDPRLVGQLPPEDVGPPTPSAADLQAAGKVNKPAQPRVNTGADKAPMPAGLVDLANLPSVGVGRDFLQRTLADNQKFDPKAYREQFLKEVGTKDLSVYDEMAEELKARKERLNAPKAGFDSLMEYLGAIAQSGGGRNWMEAGAKGAATLSSAQKARQAQQDALVDKILDLGSKKKEAEYNERLGMFNLTKAEKDKINKESAELAKSLNMSETEAEKMRQQAIENELNRKAQIRAASIGAQDRDNLMSRARALMAADPTKKMTLEQAMQRASEIASAGQMESADVRRLKGFNDAKKEIDAKLKYMPMFLDRKNKPEYAQLRAEYLAEINEARAMYGVTGQGINTLPATDASGKVPPPPGYKRD
jgi:hypothetical protein